MAIKYTQHIEWDNKCISVSVTAFSVFEARKKALELALDMGYTAPKWWQFWRHLDVDVSRWPEFKELQKKRK